MARSHSRESTATGATSGREGRSATRAARRSARALAKLATVVGLAARMASIWAVQAARSVGRGPEVLNIGESVGRVGWCPALDVQRIPPRWNHVNACAQEI